MSSVHVPTKAPTRMHEEQCDGSQYNSYSACSGLTALPPPMPRDQFTLGKVYEAQEEYTGLFGFGVKSIRQALFPNTNSIGKSVDFQGSRQMENFSRRYYEKELGAGIGPSPGLSEHFGYTRVLRPAAHKNPPAHAAESAPLNAAPYPDRLCAQLGSLRYFENWIQQVDAISSCCWLFEVLLHGMV